MTAKPCFDTLFDHPAIKFYRYDVETLAWNETL